MKNKINIERGLSLKKFGKTNKKRLLSIFLFILFIASGFSEVIVHEANAQGQSIYFEEKVKTIGPDSRGGIWVNGGYIWIADHKNGLWKANKCNGTGGDVTNDDNKLYDIYHAGNYIYGVGEGSAKIFCIYKDISGDVMQTQLQWRKRCLCIS